MARILRKHDYEVYVVGGCVRDNILGRAFSDWGVYTSTTPSGMLGVLKNKKIIEIGLQHGTIAVVANGEPYEITTYRLDEDYSDHRRPDIVTFIDNFIEDLKRRGFMANVMAYDDEADLIDPFGEMEDIRYSKINCVDSAKDRFSKDALRILRVTRFTSQFGLVMTPDTGWEIHKQYRNLENISIEEIGNEFCKIVPSSSSCVRMILYNKVFASLVSELESMFEPKQNNPYHNYNVWEHTIHAAENCEDEELVIELAILFRDIGKPHSYRDNGDGTRHFKDHGRVSTDMIDEIIKRTRFDDDTRNSVVELICYHNVTFGAGKKYIKRWLNKIGELQSRGLLQVRKAGIKGQNPDYESERSRKVFDIEASLGEVPSEKPYFSSKDLVTDGSNIKEAMMVKEGKDISYWSNATLSKVIGRRLNSIKEDLIYYMTRIING